MTRSSKLHCLYRYLIPSVGRVERVRALRFLDQAGTTAGRHLAIKTPPLFILHPRHDVIKFLH
jgi:hypothetical protein